MSRLTLINTTHTHRTASRLAASLYTDRHCIAHCRSQSHLHDSPDPPCHTVLSQPRPALFSLSTRHRTARIRNQDNSTHRKSSSTEKSRTSHHAAMAARVNTSVRLAGRRAAAAHHTVTQCPCRRPRRLFSTAGASVDKVADTDIATLARQTQHPLSLADLVK